MKFRVVIEQDEDGKFIASCPTLPGCWSQGDTRDEAKRNITDAIKGYLESLEEHGDPIPPPINEEIIDIDIGKVA
ncbi:MAG: type II toxin-antitoxin system HicB family antitoxin [Planctomycetes bacterium]|nr:type II toxin-antitoxin system HicB family antitoxin [Planctomycetota bacterium]